jgi:hypothetical protein
MTVESRTLHTTGTPLTSNAYDDLPRDHRIQGIPYSWGEVGGFDPEIRQLMWAVRGRIKEHFPVNEVPEAVVEQLGILDEVAQEFESKYEVLMDTLGRILKEKV